MFITLLRDSLASPHEDTLNFLSVFSAEEAHSTERPFSEVFPSLEETINHVLGVVNLNTFLTDTLGVTIHLVVHVMAGPSLFVVHLEELIDSRAISVWFVDEEGLEVEQVKIGLGEAFKSGLGLLGGLVSTITIFTVVLLSGLLFLLFLWGSSNLGLDALAA